MAVKTVKGVYVPRHDTEANWNKAKNFKPCKGELIVYDADSVNTKVRFKFGDGTTVCKDLPFATTEVDLSGYATEEWVKDYVLTHGGDGSTEVVLDNAYFKVTSYKYDTTTGADRFVYVTNTPDAILVFHEYSMLVPARAEQAVGSYSGQWRYENGEIIFTDGHTITEGDQFTVIEMKGNYSSNSGATLPPTEESAFLVVEEDNKTLTIDKPHTLIMWDTGDNLSLVMDTSLTHANIMIRGTKTTGTITLGPWINYGSRVYHKDGFVTTKSISTTRTITEAEEFNFVELSVINSNNHSMVSATVIA